MNKLYIDMETRSEIAIKHRGHYVYAEDPSTEILCMAVQMNNESTRLWLGPTPSKWVGNRARLPLVTSEELQAMMTLADTVHAHNASFERQNWHHSMHMRYGFQPVPFKKWRCTAAKAAMYALPRKLGEVCAALQLKQQKDDKGMRVMQKMCKPLPRSGKWHENWNDFVDLCLYCLQDVRAEYALDNALYDMPPDELLLWQLDQMINDRGVYVALDDIDNLMYKVEAQKEVLVNELIALTEGAVTSGDQVDKMVKWLWANGVRMTDLVKQNVIDTLETDIPDNCRRVLEIRQSLGKNSIAKLRTMKLRASKDSRVRGTMLYHGAGTGRWSGAGIQPHNYPRECRTEEEVDDILNCSLKEVSFLYGCPIQEASKCLRGVITAAPGSYLLCADFSSIESRVLAWLAGQTDKLDAYRSGVEIYKLVASSIYDVPMPQITDEQRTIGKVAELALGYQGWVGAFHSMAANYGLKVTDDFAAAIAGKWREANPMITQFWTNVEIAAKQAVAQQKAFSYGRVKFGMRGNFLHCRLPSGRLLSYYAPRIEENVLKQKHSISYMTMDSVAHKWKRQFTYGGKITENIVQAVARDLLAYALIRMELKGYKTVLHVHDEIVAESKDPPTPEALDRFCKIMAEVPDWAKGLPVEAKGWSGRRYRKK